MVLASLEQIWKGKNYKTNMTYLCDSFSIDQAMNSHPEILRVEA